MGKKNNCVHLRIVLNLVLIALLGLMGCRMGQTANENEAKLLPSSVPTPSPIPLLDLAFATLAPPTIEVIQQTPTPLPTATATPTPTPIVYTIQDGDTLLAIAIDNQTTVEEIQSLNPDVRPELLSIGQEITLPPPATPVFRSERPTALPIQIEVLSVSLFSDGAGGLWVLGEVKNSADYFIENLQLEITLFGEEGLMVGSKKTWAPAPQVGPNESTPFGLVFPQKPDGNLQAEIKVASGFAQANSIDEGRYYFGLTADQPQFEVNGEAISMTGKVTNNGSETAKDAFGLLLTYDNDGRLTGYSQIAFSQSLSPDESENYTSTFVPVGSEVTAVRIQTYSKK